MLKTFVPAWFVDEITSITAAELERRGIRGLLMDLDNTVCENFAEEVPAGVVEWARGLRAAGIALGVVSNGPPERTGRLAAALGAPFVARARKPLSGRARRALDLLDLRPEQVALAGDQIFTDVWVGNRLGVTTILVRPISVRESPAAAIKRPLERWLLRRMPRE